MAVDVAAAAAWFEQICAKLPTDPAYATTALTEFRDSESAFQLSASFVANLGHFSQYAQFQAVSIVRYCFVKRWAHMDASFRADLLASLLNALRWSTTNGVSNFTINKLIQTVVVVWKHKWISPSPQSIAEVKAEQLSDIRNFFSDPASARVGFAFIQECAQEFTALNTEKTEGIDIPLSAHNEARALLEAEGLEELFQLAVAALLSVLGNSDALSNQRFELISAGCKSVNELLHWSFGNSTEPSTSAFVKRTTRDEERHVGHEELKIPSVWAEFLYNQQLLERVLSSYDVCRGYGMQQAANSTATMECLSSMRLLFVSFAAISNPRFAQQRFLQWEEWLVAQLLPRLERCSESLRVSLQQTSLHHSSDILGAELVQISLVIVQILDNYSLSVLCRLSNLERLLVQSAETTVLLAQILGYAANTLSGVQQPVDGDLLGCWMYESLRNFVSALASLASDPLLVSPRTLPQGSSDLLMTIQEEHAVRTLMLSGMQTLTATMFGALFNAILAISLHLVTVEDDDEDVDETIEVLESAQLQDMIESVCCLGRLNVVASLTHLNACISQCNSAIVVVRGGGPLQQSANHMQKDRIRLCETARICLLFASHFCVEGFASSLTTDVSGNSSSTSSSSDGPAIPGLIIGFALSEPNSAQATAQQLCSLFVAACQSLQHQLQLLNNVRAGSELPSPVLVQGGLDFISAYVLRYAAPDPESYSGSYEPVELPKDQ